MKSKLPKIFAGLCLVGVAGAQTPEVKEKPPMYSYVSDFNIPRGRWAEMAKQTAEDNKMMATALASGSLIGYGDDRNLIHLPDGYSHDSWWSSMSLAGVLNVLEKL